MGDYSSIISKGIKLPLSTCRGTYAKRVENADKMTEEFFKRLLKRACSEKPLSFAEIKNDLLEISDCNINLSVVPRRINENPSFVTNLNKSNNRYTNLELRLTPSTKFLICSDKYADKSCLDGVMHEVSHFFYSINNPKALRKAVVRSSLYDSERIDSFYNNYLYNCEDNVTSFDSLNVSLINHLKKLCQHKSNAKKIDILQSFRHRLKDEMHAFKNQKRYENAKEIKAFREQTFFYKLTKFIGADMSSLSDCNWMFKEKIEILDEMLRSIIKEERTNLAAANKY